MPPVDTAAKAEAEFRLFGTDVVTLRYEVEDIEGLSGPVTAAHIHSGAKGATGDILITLDLTAEEASVELTAEQAAAIKSGDTYVDLHTEKYADGEIRGQIIACAGDHEDDEHDEDHVEQPPVEQPPAGGGAAVLTAEEPRFMVLGNFDAPFLRGDANGDKTVGLTDAVKILGFLFRSDGRPYCLDAADANDDGSINLSDAVAVLFHVFIGGPDLPEPGTLIPGTDSTADRLYCNEQP